MKLFVSLLVVLYVGAIHQLVSSSSSDVTDVIVRHGGRERLDDLHLGYCQKPARCQTLNYTTCMGTRVPYSSTTMDLTDLNTQAKVQEKLLVFQHLRFIPKCWAVVQPFICALYMPKCEDGMVDLPSREMCRITLEPCKMVFYNSSMFPAFLDCEDSRLFPSKCKNDVHELKFNTTGFCMEPLVKTDQSDWFYPDVEGCGLRCKDSLYTENEHRQIRKLTINCVLLCIILNLFAILTFLIDWNAANKYPALAIFYVNVCFLISYGGWLIQFLGSESREDVVCKKDGTLRKSEPSATENLSCVVVFVMVYYFAVAGMVWFVIFSYAWHMSSLQALGKIQERVDKKRAYFHLVAWSLPLILTITTMALGEIDGDYVTGICFVGYINAAARSGLLLAPLAAAMTVAGYITVRGLVLLIRVKVESRDVISERSNRKIRSNIVRMGVFVLFMVVFCVITFVYHGYLALNSTSWRESLHDYILCKLTSFGADFSHCKQESRPSVAMLQLQLLAVFGSGIAMASWVWCGATLHSWARYVRKKFHCQVDEPMKLQKHKIIAQAFAKRKKFNEGGKISIECQNHTDPVGLHFELNSAASNGLSTTWAANLPRLVNRRGAVINDAAYSISSNNQSIDSEVSLNVRHVSIESRRNSGDSQLSVQIAELKATRKINSRHRHHDRMRNRNKRDYTKGGNSKRANSRDFLGSTRKLSKRDSSTSLDSHLQLINAFSDVKNLRPNMKRRKATAGLDGQHINKLLSNGKIVIPYNINDVVAMKSESEDENVSVTISESKFNMVVNNRNNLDLNDHLVMKSLKRDLRIRELHSDDTKSEDDDIDDEDENVVVISSTKKKHRERSRCESRSSKRSRKKQTSDSDDDDDSLGSSSCPEIKRLVQSSLNSGVSMGHEKSHGSRQSKTSIDVAVQANAHDIVKQTTAYDLDSHDKSKKQKTKDVNDAIKVHKRNLREGSVAEYEPLHKKSQYYSDYSDEEHLLTSNFHIDIRKSNEIC